MKLETLKNVKALGANEAAHIKGGCNASENRGQSQREEKREKGNSGNVDFTVGVGRPDVVPV